MPGMRGFSVPGHQGYHPGSQVYPALVETWMGTEHSFLRVLRLVRVRSALRRYRREPGTELEED